MVLSNAERQARYRKNLKKRADDPGASARAAADAAAAVLWAFYNRSTGDGRRWGDVEGFDSLDQWRASLRDGALVESCRVWVRDGGAEEDGMTPAELATLAVIVEIDDAIRLKHPKGK